jgi:hypothetical protein
VSWNSGKLTDYHSPQMKGLPFLIEIAGRLMMGDQKGSSFAVDETQAISI